MFYLKNKCISFFMLLCVKLLKRLIGRVPQHLAFIMDGNRRYATKNSMDTNKGHCKGFDKLKETVKWCLVFGIPEVTVYAFSIENFNRSKDEVNTLINLFREKFTILLEEMDQLKEHGIRLHIVGRLSLLPDDLRMILSRIMLASRHHNKLRLNMAIAYTGRDEISRAASLLVDAVQRKEISPDDIDETLVSKTMELGEPELMIRTSGEVRISDFMLWQVSNTILYFTDVLWPEFSVWNLLAAIRHYQRYNSKSKETKDLSAQKKEFLANLEMQRWTDIENTIKCG